jgi:hypothetical protein
MEELKAKFRPKKVEKGRARVSVHKSVRKSKKSKGGLKND